MPPYAKLAGLFTRAAPWPGNAAPCVEGICQVLPTQSVRFTATVEFTFCAESSSITFCASCVAVVSLLLRLSVSMLPTNRVVSAPSPTARISMAIINSMRVAPASAFFLKTALSWSIRFMASFRLLITYPGTRGASRKSPSADSSGRRDRDRAPTLRGVVLENDPVGCRPNTHAVAHRPSRDSKWRTGKTARTESHRSSCRTSVLEYHGGISRQHLSLEPCRVRRGAYRLLTNFLWNPHRGVAPICCTCVSCPKSTGSSVVQLGVNIHKRLAAAIPSDYKSRVIAVIIHSAQTLHLYK